MQLVIFWILVYIRIIYLFIIISIWIMVNQTSKYGMQLVWFLFILV